MDARNGFGGAARHAASQKYKSQNAAECVKKVSRANSVQQLSYGDAAAAKRDHIHRKAVASIQAPPGSRQNFFGEVNFAERSLSRTRP
jgi:hypothetical protein